MQDLTAPPRDHLTQEQVEASLAWQHSTRLRWGVDLLNSELDETGIDIEVTDASVEWQWRAQPVEGEPPTEAKVRRQGSLTYRHQADFNPLSVLYRLWVEMEAPPVPTSTFLDAAQALSPRAVWLPGEAASDGVFTDESGNGYDGTLVNSPATSGAGGPGDGLTSYASFNGSDQYADLTTLTGWGPNVPNATVGMWIRSITTEQGRFLGTVNDDFTTAFQLRTNEDHTATFDEGKVASWTRDDSDFDTVQAATTSDTDVFDGSWHLVVFRFDLASDPASVSIRIDKTELGVSQDATNPVTTADFDYSLALAASNTRGSIVDYAEIDVAAVLLFDTNLSDADADSLYDAALMVDVEPAAWVRWHLGVFTATMPPYEYEGMSDQDGPRVMRPLELADRSHFWQSDETRDPVTVDQGTNIVQFVKDDLSVRFSEPDVSGITDGGQTAGEDYVFDAGTPWQEVYNTLLAAIGNEPLHTDADGLAQSAPLIDPEQREAEHDYSFGSTVVPEASVEAVNPELPNVIRFVARRWDGTTEEGDGIRTIVNDMTGPGSRQARGGRTVLNRIQVDAQTQDDLNAQARALAPFYFAGGGLRYTGQVGLNPRHDDTDVVFLERPPMGIEGNWLVTSWSITLGTADDMRAMDLELERLTGAAFVSQTPVPVGAYGTAMYGAHPYGGTP